MLCKVSAGKVYAAAESYGVEECDATKHYTSTAAGKTITKIIYFKA
jgi:hypothetical protein